MPDRSSCPKCAVKGMNRMEHVIHAGYSYRSFECHACGHQWRDLETGEHVPTIDDDAGAPDRSRTSQLPDRRMNPDRRNTSRSDRRKRH